MKQRKKYLSTNLNNHFSRNRKMWTWRSIGLGGRFGNLVVIFLTKMKK